MHNVFPHHSKEEGRGVYYLHKKITLTNNHDYFLVRYVLDLSFFREIKPIKNTNISFQKMFQCLYFDHCGMKSKLSQLVLFEKLQKFNTMESKRLTVF